MVRLDNWIFEHRFFSKLVKHIVDEDSRLLRFCLEVMLRYVVLILAYQVL
jgi:hypothetical protein